MKKLLTFLTLLTLFFTTGWAETVTKTITFSSSFSPSLPTASGSINSTATSHTVEGLSIAEAGIYKGTSNSYLMFVQNKGYLYNTENLGTIKSVAVTYTGGTSSTGQAGVYFGNSVQSTYTITSNNLVEQSGTQTWTNETSGYGYFQFSTSNKNVQVTKIVITYEEVGDEPPTPTCATPTFSPAAGTYYEPVNVTLSTTTPDAVIRYTTDGNDPDNSSVEYNGPITVNETMTIKAIATATGFDPSSVASATYTIFEPETVTPTYEQSLISGFGKFYYVDKTNPTTSAIWKSNNYGAVASGQISGTKYDTESWLYTPYIDLTNATNPELSFSHAGNYFTDVATMQSDVQVMVRQLNGTNWSDWSVLTIDTWPTGAGWTFVDNTTSLSTYAGKTIQIAFKYTSSTSRAGTWEIKNFKIENVATKYSVTCNTADNGSITTDEDEYAEGETVNVTVTPDPGYELATLVYNDGEDHDIKDAKSFTMPASNVTVTATFSKVGDLYVMGNVNGIDVNGWHANQGVKMDFINGAYTADIWVTGKWNDEMQKNAGSFAFTKVLANNGSGDGAWGWVNGYGHRIQPSADGKYYWLNSGSVSNIPLYVRGDNDGEKEFLIPAGLYTITVTPANPSVQNDTWKFSLVEKNLTPTITPDGGDVALNSTATVALQENYNDFIANCPKVTECTPSNGSDVYTELTLTLPEVKLYVNNDAVEGVSSEYEFATVGSVTLTGKGALLLNGSEITSATKTATFNVTEVDMSNVYTLVKSATDLVAGGEYLIVSSKGDDTYNVLIGEIGGTTAKPYATAIIEASIYDATRECITLPEGCLATPLTLGYDETTQKYTFYNGSGYLNSPADDNYLNTSSSISNTSQWIIDTNEFPASNKLIQNSERTTRYIEFNASSPRFACYAGTQQPVALFKKVSSTPTNKTATPVITPESQDVKGGLLTGITIAPGEENTNPAIWYTTDGSDPSDANNAERKPYTVPFNIQVTQGGPQTVKAIAIEEGKDPSNIATVTYMFKNPDAPTFTPDPAVVQTGDFTITINSADGGTIYYVLDPDANEVPSNSQEVIDANNVYKDGVSVSGYDTHRIYAVVELNGLKSTIANATYTVIETGAEGDWTLVTSADQIKAGREYIIVNSDRDRAIKSGDLETTRFYSTLCEGHVVFGPNFATATVVGTDVRVFGFDTESNNIYMKDADGSRYYNFSSDVSATTTAVQPVYISMSDGFVYIKGAADATRSLAYNTDYGNYFGIYATPTSTTGSQHPIYMYYRDIKSMYLADIEAAENGGVVGTRYAIADGYLVAVEARDVTIDGDENSYAYVWCKDDNNVTNKLTPAEGVIDFMKQQGEVGMPSTQPWDQSNWVVLRFKNPSSANDPKALKGHKVTGIVGTYVDATNYMIDVESYTKGEAESYTPNVYCVANFNPANWGANGVQQPNAAANAPYYFFMTPKVQEVCHITFAEWTGSTFTVPASSDFTKNTLTLGWDYNQNEAGTPVDQTTLETYLNDNNVVDPQTGKLPAYEFDAIVQATGSKGAITGGSKVYPTNLTGSSNVVTAISTVNVGNGVVKSVKYVNVAGIVSDRPFQGVNIVIIEYTDGSRTTSKMLKK